MDLTAVVVIFIGAIAKVFFYDGIVSKTVNQFQKQNYDNQSGLSHLISRSKEWGVI